MDELDKQIADDIERSHCDRCEQLAKHSINEKCNYHQKYKFKNIDKTLKFVSKLYGYKQHRENKLKNK